MSVFMLWWAVMQIPVGYAVVPMTLCLQAHEVAGIGVRPTADMICIVRAA